MRFHGYALLAAVVCGATVAQADDLVNTFGPSGIGYFPSVGWTIDGGQSLGKTFSIASSFTLSEIDVALRMDGDSDQMLVSLRSDASGQPDAALEAFTVTSGFGAGTAGVYALTSVTNPILAAGTYYVTIEPLNGATGKWNLNNGGGQGSMVVSSDGGSSWTGFTDTNGAIRVQGAAVPEPATMTVLGLATMALLKRRRR